MGDGVCLWRRAHRPFLQGDGARARPAVPPAAAGAGRGRRRAGILLLGRVRQRERMFLPRLSRLVRRRADLFGDGALPAPGGVVPQHGPAGRDDHRLRRAAPQRGRHRLVRPYPRAQQRRRRRDLDRPRLPAGGDRAVPVAAQDAARRDDPAAAEPLRHPVGGGPPARHAQHRAAGRDGAQPHPDVLSDQPGRAALHRAALCAAGHRRA